LLPWKGKKVNREKMRKVKKRIAKKEKESEGEKL
jgi:hypothetical protein